MARPRLRARSGPRGAATDPRAPAAGEFPQPPNRSTASTCAAAATTSSSPSERPSSARSPAGGEPRSPPARWPGAPSEELDDLLEGGPLPRLRAQLSDLAESLRYEEAARLRDRITALEQMIERLRRLDRLRAPRALSRRSRARARLAKGLLRLRRQRLRRSLTAIAGRDAAPGRGGARGLSGRTRASRTAAHSSASGRPPPPRRLRSPPDSRARSAPARRRADHDASVGRLDDVEPGAPPADVPRPQPPVVFPASSLLMRWTIGAPCSRALGDLADPFCRALRRRTRPGSPRRDPVRSLALRRAPGVGAPRDPSAGRCDACLRSEP